MTEQRKPPTLAELMRANPEARAYMEKLNRSIAAQYHDEPVTCDVCGGLGVVRVDLPLDHPMFGKPIPCPGKNGVECPVVTQQRRERYDKLNMQAQIPLGYQALTFDSWRELEQYPAHPPPRRRVPVRPARRTCGHARRVSERRRHRE